MKKRKTLRNSFIVTFAGTASMAIAATGCNVGTTNPPEAYCPDEQPAQGGECDLSELPEECVYGEKDSCGNVITATCVDDAWEIDYGGTCNPPMVECPDTVPTSGDACGDGLGSCQYSDECNLPVTASCVSSTWEVQYEGTCNPPPPCDFNETAEGCGLDPSCRWLTPGCAEGDVVALPQEGCFPATPCIDDTECGTLTCQDVVVMPPCEGADCACSAPTKVCL